MMSLKLWQAMTFPPHQHPLYRYARVKADSIPPKTESSVFIWFVALVGVFFCGSSVFGGLPLVLFCLLIFAITLLGTFWAGSLSEALAKEKSHHRYDLYGVLPSGTLLANWALCLGYLHRKRTFIWGRFVARMFLFSSMSAFSGMLLFNLFVLEKASDNWFPYELSNSELLFVGLGFSIGFFIDFIQTTTISCLLSIFTQTRTENTLDARLLGMGLVVIVQVLVYATVIMSFVSFTPQIYGRLLLAGLPAIPLIVILNLGAFILLREVVIQGLWAYLKSTLAADETEPRKILS